MFGKRTFSEQSEIYHITSKTLQRQYDEIILPQKVPTPRPICLCMDASYFGEKLCAILFRDQKKKEDLHWSFTTTETISEYREGMKILLEQGYTIQSITADGFPGIPKIYEDIPFQYCHFHAVKTITTYTTKRPKTEPGKELLEIIYNLQQFNETSFKNILQRYIEKYQTFLSEESFNPFTGKSWPTHKRILQALASMIRMSPYLFTYQKYPHLNIPTTTNTIEGHWKHIEARVNVHHGLSLKRKIKLLTTIFLNSTTTYTQKTWKRLFQVL